MPATTPFEYYLGEETHRKWNSLGPPLRKLVPLGDAEPLNEDDRVGDPVSTVNLLAMIPLVLDGETTSGGRTFSTSSSCGKME